MPNKPKITQPETPNEIQGRDLFSTPNYAIELLMLFIPKNIKYVWECAGRENGKIANVLTKNNYKVYSSDLGYPNKEDNFLTSEFPTILKREESVIITNPPYSLKKKFYERCRYFNVPFALLIPCDYCGWIIDALMKDGCEKIIPTRRIDYITPSGKEGKASSSQFHSMWLTCGFRLGKTETFVELTKEMKQNV